MIYFNRMRDLLERNVHSIILTSGTLSPLAATITEIGIPINVQLQNSHVIKDNQASDVKNYNYKLFESFFCIHFRSVYRL